MHRLPLLLVGALVLAPAAAFAQAPVPSTPPPAAVPLPADLDRVLRDYENAWRAGDEDALARLFTNDGFVPTSAGWRRGTEAIREAYRNGGGDLRLSAHAWAVSDTVGYIVGAYVYGEGPGGGKFVLALRRGAGGRWLIAADLDNANRRP